MERAETSVKIAIFSGGAGSRLWPVSRIDRPKQFQPLTGKESLFQHMIGLLDSGFGIENVFVFTGSNYVQAVREQAPGLPHANIVAEPEMRDTLAAMGYAAAVIEHRFPGTLLATLWGGDHIIREEDEFKRSLHAACALARDHGKSVMVDVRPTFPSTQLGYVELGPRFGTIEDFDVYAFQRFSEKPDLHTARRYVEDGRHLWNTGYFVWSSATILELYRTYAPEAYACLENIMATMGTPREDEVTREYYAQIPKMSVDYGVFAHIPAGDMLAMPVNMGWADVGAWDVLRDELSDGKGSNVVLTDTHVGIDTHNSLIYSSSRKLVATVGIDNLVIVDTDDALLVAPADRAQDIKRIVEQLRADGRLEHL